MKKAVVLLSGGLDSATALYMARSEGYEVYALSFDYGQRHSNEIECAEKIAKLAGVKEHVTINTNMNAWGGSALTDSGIEVPKGDLENDAIPVTYVPARNMIFLAYAASYAEVKGASDIFIGVSQVDYSGYVDCRKEFIEAMENVINLGTVCAVEQDRKIKVRAPFINMKKSEEIGIGMKLGLDYSNTWTCYNGEDEACGECDSCRLRLKAFEEAGFADPIKYKTLK